jgi:hypothetical protein
MATSSWHLKATPCTALSQRQDIARRGPVAKHALDGPAPIHPGHSSRTTTTLGAPPTGGPPDASSSLPTDPSIMGKAFPIPAVTYGTPARVAKMHDPGLAHAIMAEAYHGPADFARDLHTVLPDKPSKK